MSSIERAAAQVDDADAVLVLRPQSASAADAECKRLLVEDPTATELLGVSFSQSPGMWYDDWRETLGTTPAAAAVVTTSELATTDAAEREFAVEDVATPSNLTGIGVKLTPYLSEWREAVVAVESLTVLLQYADTQSVYRFLHVLTSRIRATGSTGQFYLDPAVHDDQTVELLKSLFDGVLECERTLGGDDGEDGDRDGWTARFRGA